jgi:predicted nucleic acid-binding protein
MERILRYQRTAYDALYLDLAMREKLPVATLDNGLIQACVEANVPVVLV